jgi:uncharacterized protein YqkB
MLSGKNKHYGASKHPTERCAAAVSFRRSFSVWEKLKIMKILLMIVALVTAQTFAASAQDNSKNTNENNTEIAVTIIKQSGSRRFRCIEKPGVFNYEYDLQSRVEGNPDCVNPFDLLKVDSNKQTLIGYRVLGDCFVHARAEVFRNDETKIYRVNIRKKSGGCRAGGIFQGWIVVEKLPADYKTEFSETNADESDDFKIELLEETLSLTEESQEVKTRTYDMDRCVYSFREGLSIIRSQDELLKKVRDDASRKACLERLEKIDFKKEILIGTTIYSGYCRYPLGLKHPVLRDDRRKRYMLLITYDDPYGRTCRALGVYDLWLAVPKPPENYEIKIEVASVLNKKYDY